MTKKIAIGIGLRTLNIKNQNNDFLYFYLLTLGDYFNQKTTGFTFLAITVNVIKYSYPPAPPFAI